MKPSVTQAPKPTDRRQSLDVTLPDKAVRTLARGIFEQLQQEGCCVNDIISVSTQLISLVTSEIRGDMEGGNKRH